MELKRLLIGNADVDESLVRLVAAGTGETSDKQIVVRHAHNSGKSALAERVRLLASKKSDSRGVRACECGRTISANAKQCAKCAGLV